MSSPSALERSDPDREDDGVASPDTDNGFRLVRPAP
jgi:hypothetical protein